MVGPVAYRRASADGRLISSEACRSASASLAGPLTSDLTKVVGDGIDEQRRSLFEGEGLPPLGGRAGGSRTSCAGLVVVRRVRSASWHAWLR